MAGELAAWRDTAESRWMIPCLAMSGLGRIGVAIDSDLLDNLFRDPIRDELAEQAWEAPESQVIGTVTLLYNHHVRQFNQQLTSVQRDPNHAILSSLHVHRPR